MIYAVIQAVIITAIVAFCALQMFRRLLPKLSRDLQAKSAHALSQAGMSAMAQKLEPVEAPDSGCGSGCGSCKGCSTSFDLKP